MVQPLTPPTVAPTSAAGSWFEPEPTTAPPARDPPRWWTVAPAPASEHKRIRYELIAMFVLIALPGFLVGLDGITDPATIDIDGLSILELLGAMAGTLGAGLMAAHLLWRDGRLPAAGFNRRRPRFVLGYGLLGWVCCFGAVFVVSIVAYSIMAGAGAEPPTRDADDSGISFTAASLAAGYLISLCAGVSEEIAFRAYAITRLEQLGWGKKAFIVPGVVFTVLHLYQGLLALAVIGGVTAVLTWLFKWKRSLLPVMAAHAFFDAGQITIAALYSKYGS